MTTLLTKIVLSEDQLSDEKRGYIPARGAWMSFEDSFRKVFDQEVLEKAQIKRFLEEFKPQEECGCTKDKPAWVYSDPCGNMYIGYWERHDGVSKEKGEGLSYHREGPSSCGRVFFGKCDQGIIVEGSSFWMPSSWTWRLNNRLRGSKIKDNNGNGIPYNYVGKYEDGLENDDNALVTLQNGNRKRMKWVKGEPDLGRLNAVTRKRQSTAGNNATSNKKKPKKEQQLEQAVKELEGKLRAAEKENVSLKSSCKSKDDALNDTKNKIKEQAATIVQLEDENKKMKGICTTTRNSVACGANNASPQLAPRSTAAAPSLSAPGSTTETTPASASSSTQGSTGGSTHGTSSSSAPPPKGPTTRNNDWKKVWKKVLHQLSKISWPAK